MSLVYFSADDTVRLADSNPGLVPGRPPVGLCLDALVNGDIGTIVLNGEITYDQWNWAGHAGSPVYCDSFGQITLSRPPGLMAFRVGFIKNPQTVLLSIDSETTPQIYTADVNSLLIAGQSPVTTTDVINGLGERVVTVIVPNATPSTSGLITGAMVTQYNAYGAQISTNTADIATLQTSKANTVHTHVIADVTGLQLALNTLTTAVGLKIDHVTPVVAGNFPALTALGNLVDSGKKAADFALAGHTHLISDVTGLQTALDQKSFRAHLTAISEIFTSVDRTGPFDVGTAPTLSSILSGKMNIGDAIPISQVTNLQTSLNGKINVGTNFPISQITGLQGELDNRAFVSHTHVIADVTGLQTALNNKAPLVHVHVASSITDFSEAVDDRVAQLLVAGPNITLTYNDAANTLTVAATGGTTYTPALITQEVSLGAEILSTFVMRSEILEMQYYSTYQAFNGGGALPWSGQFDTTTALSGIVLNSPKDVYLDSAGATAILGTVVNGSSPLACEFVLTQPPNNARGFYVGVFTQAYGPPYSPSQQFGGPLSTYYYSEFNGSDTGGYGTTPDRTLPVWQLNDVLGVVFNVPIGTVSFFRNGTFIRSVSLSNNSNCYPMCGIYQTS